MQHGSNTDGGGQQTVAAESYTVGLFDFICGFIRGLATSAGSIIQRGSGFRRNSLADP